MARPRSLGAIAAEGDHLKTLEALRDRLARKIDSPKTSPRDFAALTRQLTSVLADIAAQKRIQRLQSDEGSAGAAETPAEPTAESGGTGLDEFTRRLADKRGSAAAATG
ncbi:hypothetical protein GS926_14870 [Rhodococcus hoagii]|nr:hypothetical protein [Prescottella equi]MBM4517708.1 hypothetical protein [Prescottella equi]MBM4577207.1 hypothetical protein [Prescottella equi]NKV09758.1 hypothetical protein [Prescottella equi]NKV45429.1 hypothetical protein [Prescottella equi]